MNRPVSEGRREPDAGIDLEGRWYPDRSRVPCRARTPVSVFVIILDEGVPKEVTRSLPGHDVTTVPDAG